MATGTWAWFFCLVFHREQTVSWAELRQASVKSPARVELSLAYSLLTVENQTKKPGPGRHRDFARLWRSCAVSWVAVWVYGPYLARRCACGTLNGSSAARFSSQAYRTKTSHSHQSDMLGYQYGCTHWQLSMQIIKGNMSIYLFYYTDCVNIGVRRQLKDQLL